MWRKYLKMIGLKVTCIEYTYFYFLETFSGKLYVVRKVKLDS